MIFEKSLRWFGDSDPISLPEIKQAGAEAVVTALHHMSNGSVWPIDEIQPILDQIQNAGLRWHVVESLPVHDAIKRGIPERDGLIKNYIQSMRNLASCGIDTICYNFMPVLDWVRTDIHYQTPEGAESMLFDYTTFAAFDIHILKRLNAKDNYPKAIVNQAQIFYNHLPDEKARELAHTIIVETQGFIDGFSGASHEDYLEGFRNYLALYHDIDSKLLRENLGYFLDQIIPVAEECGLKMAIHADDPAFPVLGLPRIVSTLEDLEWIFNRQNSVNNGLTFCSGSLGSNQQNNLNDIIAECIKRIHFVHLRNMVFTAERSFYESGHIEGNLDMVALIKALSSNRKIPMRPDHGLKILDDYNRQANPGYPLIGRMKGLAEIRGIEKGLKH